MPKYLTLWEMDTSKMPVDPRERMVLMQKNLEMVKQSLKERPGDEWGIFLGEAKGYVIGSAGWQDVEQAALMFYPNIKFTVHQALSAGEYEEPLNSLMAGAAAI